MTLAEFHEAVADAHAENPSWRLGQTYFNILYVERPDLSEQVRATPHDPFHRDERIPDFLAFVSERW